MRVSCSTPPLPSRISLAAITTRLLCPIDWADLHCSGAQTPNMHEIHSTIPADDCIRLFSLCPYLTLEWEPILSQSRRHPGIVFQRPFEISPANQAGGGESGRIKAIWNVDRDTAR